MVSYGILFLGTIAVLLLIYNIHTIASALYLKIRHRKQRERDKIMNILKKQ